MTDIDDTSYTPFRLFTDEITSLTLFQDEMLSRVDVFEEQGWLGNGYDWTSIAEVVLDEHLPDLRDCISFDPEAGMFSADGPVEALRLLGKQLKMVFDNKSLLLDILSRAEQLS